MSRKACVACGCSTVDHAPESDLEDDQRMGRLLGDSPCSHLTAKVKGGGGLRVYKRNRMIVTNPVVSRKDPTFNTTTYDWAPAGLNQKLVRQGKMWHRKRWYRLHGDCILSLGMHYFSLGTLQLCPKNMTIRVIGSFKLSLDTSVSVWLIAVSLRVL